MQMMFLLFYHDPFYSFRASVRSYYIDNKTQTESLIPLNAVNIEKLRGLFSELALVEHHFTFVLYGVLHVVGCYCTLA